MDGLKRREARGRTRRRDPLTHANGELENLITISGDNGWRDPPVPIPNTEVKPPRADGTWLETARESRSLPESTRERDRDSVSFPLSYIRGKGDPEGAGERPGGREARWARVPMKACRIPREDTEPGTDAGEARTRAKRPMARRTNPRPPAKHTPNPDPKPPPPSPHPAFLSSSMAEHSAVNRRVVGSSPT